MIDDKNILKSRLRDFVNSCGIEINTRKKPNVIQCPNPNHADGTPSAILYAENVHCPVCNESYDIFEVAGFVCGTDKFPEKVKYVREKLGVITPEKKQKIKKEKHDLVPIEFEKAKQLFDSQKVRETGRLRGWGKFTDVWYYRNENGLVNVADIRFNGDKKAVVSFFYDGNSFRYSGCPIHVFNLDKIAEDRESKILICEGAKCAVAADSLPGFIGSTWNGGSKKAKYADWSSMKNRDVYIYPDDDLQKDKNGKNWPWYRQPGYLAAFEIKKKLPNAIIVKPLPDARKIKPSGADIIEALQCVTPEELAEYILQCDPVLHPSDQQREPGKAGLPFKVLGNSDDGRAYFVGVNGRLVDLSTTSLNKTQLINLADISWWRDNFGFENKINWDDAVNFVVNAATGKAYNTDNIRGRGAWKDKESRCYNDGQKVTGPEVTDKYYLKANKIDIGLEHEHADKELANSMSAAISRMSFETPLDCIRMLGWALLAPFAGALPWRPAVLITGESQSGKSTLIEQVLKPLSLPEMFSGGGTTEAGVRQWIGSDSLSVVVEEAEADTKKKKKNREDLFSLMRQSTSDDAPRIAKGTATGKPIKYRMRSMFLFAAISPDIEHSADDNRIFRVNMIVAKNKWAPIRDDIRKFITVENCKRVRALTWSKLDYIIEEAERIAPIIQEVTDKNIRYCYAEGLLQSAYWNIWKGRDEIPETELRATFSVLMGMAQDDDSRDEPNEMLDRILDERVLIESPRRDYITLREILLGIKNGELYTTDDDDDFSLLDSRDISYFKNTAGRNGIALIDKTKVAVASNHHEIMKILERGKGYHRQLWRHENIVEKSAVVKMAGKSRRCVVIDGVLED